MEPGPLPSRQSLAGPRKQWSFFWDQTLLFKELTVSRTHLSITQLLHPADLAFQGSCWNPSFSQNTGTERHCINKQDKYIVNGFPKVTRCMFSKQLPWGVHPAECWETTSKKRGGGWGSSGIGCDWDFVMLRSHLSVCVICLSCMVAGGDSGSAFATEGEKKRLGYQWNRWIGSCLNKQRDFREAAKMVTIFRTLAPFPFEIRYFGCSHSESLK